MPNCSSTALWFAAVMVWGLEGPLSLHLEQITLIFHVCLQAPWHTLEEVFVHPPERICNPFNIFFHPFSPCNLTPGTCFFLSCPGRERNTPHPIVIFPLRRDLIVRLCISILDGHQYYKTCLFLDCDPYVFPFSYIYIYI